MYFISVLTIVWIKNIQYLDKYYTFNFCLIFSWKQRLSVKLFCNVEFFILSVIGVQYVVTNNYTVKTGKDTCVSYFK